jgi:hypothetical protein
VSAKRRRSSRQAGDRHWYRKKIPTAAITSRAVRE